jgi:hypothetical protein
MIDRVESAMTDHRARLMLATLGLMLGLVAALTVPKTEEGPR